MEMTLESIEALVNLATDKHLSELTIENDDQKITIKTGMATVVASPIAAQPVSLPPVTPTQPAAAQEAKPVASEAAPSNFYKITSPMVGTFYSAPSPESPPFASVGDTVSKGQTVCIIEAMKLMNELESEVSGVVRKILVNNGQPVEFGQVLMEIEVQGS